MIRRRLPMDVYNRAITLLYGSVEEINAVLRRDVRHIDEPPESAPVLARNALGKWVRYCHNGYDADYICIVKRGTLAGQMAVLTHEALHCASHALRMAGIAHTDETEEAYCYYHQWLFVQCAMLMRGRRK